MNKHKFIVMCVGTLFLALFNTIGHVTENSIWENPFRVSISLSFFVGMGILIFFMLTVLFYCIESIKSKSITGNRFEMMIMSMDLRLIFIILVIAWLPYCLMHYTARLGGGAGNQLRMFFGDETRAWLLSSVKYDGHYLVSHHPVLITMYYGVFWLIGIRSGNSELDDYGAHSPDWVVHLTEEEKAVLERIIPIPLIGHFFRNTFFA